MKLLFTLSVIIVLLFSPVAAAGKKVPPPVQKVPAAASQPQTIELASGWAIQDGCQGERTGRDHRQPGIRRRRLVSGRDGAGNGHGRADRQRRLQGYIFRQEPGDDPGRAVQGALVVPPGIRPAQGSPVHHGAADLRRHQLPGQHLPERGKDRRRRQGIRRLPGFRPQRQRPGRDREELPGRGGFSAPTRRPHHRLRGLEPQAPGPQHGHLPPGAGETERPRIPGPPVRQQPGGYRGR